MNEATLKLIVQGLARSKCSSVAILTADFMVRKVRMEGIFGQSHQQHEPGAERNPKVNKIL